MKRLFWRDRSEETFPAGVRVLMAGYRIFGRGFGDFITWWVIAAYWLFNPRARRISREYLDRAERFAEKSGKGRLRLSTLAHFERFGHAIAERILAWSGEMTRGEADYRDGAFGRLQELSREGRSVLLLSSHLGNTEILRAFNTRRLRVTVNVLTDSRNSRKMAEIIRSAGPESAIHVVEAGDEDAVMKAFLGGAIERGEWFAMMADRLTGEGSRRTVQAELLGERVTLPASPWIVASAFRLPVFLLHAVRTGRRCSVYLKEIGPVALDRRNRSASAARYAEMYCRELERLILEAPYDWFNFYDFWREDAGS